MKKIFLTIIPLIFFSINLLGQSQITQEEYDFFQNYLENKYVLVRNTVSFDPLTIQDAKKKLRKAPKELFVEFQNRNLKSFRIENKLNGFRFDDEPKPNNSSAKEINFIFDELVIVSRVAFTKDKNQALFFCSYFSEIGRGCFPNLYWLIKKNGKWEIKGSYAPWIC